ncbi:hypothetical protein HDU93_008856 [Gonapodya sp. JEL0774]|nr:hypothetical protein HDU93_008856 [Gonapodya sp. JEL0774]
MDTPAKAVSSAPVPTIPGTKPRAPSLSSDTSAVPSLSYETRDIPMEPSLPFGLEQFVGFREEYERAGVVVVGLLIAYFLGSWRMGWVWVLGLAAAAAGIWKRNREAQYRRMRAQIKRELAAEKVGGTCRHPKPAEWGPDVVTLTTPVRRMNWTSLQLSMKFSDLEAAEWFNLLLARFWLIYEPSLSETLTNVIDAVLDSATPNFLQSLKLTTFTLGSQGPRIECVKSFPHEEQDVVQWLLHITFTPLSNDDIKIARNDRSRRNILRVSGASYTAHDANKLYGTNPPGPPIYATSGSLSSVDSTLRAAGTAAGLKTTPRAQLEGDGLGYDPKNSQVVLTARVGKGMVTVPVAVEVKDVELDLQLIVRMKLIPSFPHIGTVTILMPPYAPAPYLNFSLSALNVEVFNIPGLAEWINTMVVGGLQGFLGGEGYTLDLAGMMTASGVYGFELVVKDETVGVLAFSIFEARNLKNVDLLGGKSDPYARILLGSDSHPIPGAKTRVVENNLNPAWNETVYVLIPASAFKDVATGADLLKVEIMDYNNTTKHASRTVDILIVSNLIGLTVGVTRTLKLSRWLKLFVEHELEKIKPVPAIPDLSLKDKDGGIDEDPISPALSSDEKRQPPEVKDLSVQIPDVVMRGGELTESERTIMMEDWGGPWGGDDVWAKLFENGSMRATSSEVRLEVQYLPLKKLSASGDPLADNINNMAQSPSGVLRVQLQQVKDLDGSRSLSHVLNPYVKVKLSGKDEILHTSKTKKRTNNPIFTEIFEVFVQDVSTSSLHFQIWDSRDLVTDVVLGEAIVTLPEALRRKVSDDWYNVSGVSGSRSAQSSAAKMRLNFSFFPVTLGENQEMAEEGGGISKSRRPLGIARLTLKNASKLKNAEAVGVSDPYVAISLSGNLLHRTKTIENDLNPIWDQTFYIIVYSANDRLELQVFDYNEMRKDKSMGRVEFPLITLFPDMKSLSKGSTLRDRSPSPSSRGSPTSTVENLLSSSMAMLGPPPVLQKDGVKFVRSESELGQTLMVSTPLFQRKNNTGGTVPGELNFEVSYHPVVRGTFSLYSSTEGIGARSSTAISEGEVSLGDGLPSLQGSSLQGSGIIRVRIQQVRKLINNPPNVYCALLSFDGQGDEVAFETKAKSDRDPVFEDVSLELIDRFSVFETFVRDLSSARFFLQVCRKFEGDRSKLPSERILGQIDAPLETIADKFGKSEWIGFTGAPGAAVPQGEVKVVVTVSPVDIKFAEVTSGKGSLRLDIQSAEGLFAADSDGLSDPYCRVIVDGRKLHTTKIVKDSLNPIFAESISFDIPSKLSSKVEIEVWDWNRLKDKRLGRVLVDIKTLLSGATVERSLPLEKAENGIPAKGKLNFAVSFTENEGSDWKKRFPRAGKIADAFQWARTSESEGRNSTAPFLPSVSPPRRTEGPTDNAANTPNDKPIQLLAERVPTQTLGIAAVPVTVTPPTPLAAVESVRVDYLSETTGTAPSMAPSGSMPELSRSRSSSLLSINTDLPRDLSSGTCTVHVEGATGIHKRGETLPDTYVKIARDGHKEPVLRSKVIKKNLSPIWNEGAAFRLRSREPCVLDVEVKSHRLLDSDVIGVVKFDLRKHLREDPGKWTKEGAWAWDGTLELDSGIVLRLGLVFKPGSQPPSPSGSETRLSNGGLFSNLGIRRNGSTRSSTGHSLDDT